MVKADHRKKAGPLQPIPPPERKWSQITTDLVTDLPEAEGDSTDAGVVGKVVPLETYAH